MVFFFTGKFTPPQKLPQQERGNAFLCLITGILAIGVNFGLRRGLPTMPIRGRAAASAASPAADASCAAEVLVRIFGEFCAEFPAAEMPEYKQRMLEVRPGLGPLSVKDVLISVFASADTVH